MRHSYRNAAANYSVHLIWFLLATFVERVMSESSVCFWNARDSNIREKLTCIDDQAKTLLPLLQEQCSVRTSQWDNLCPPDPWTVTHYGHGIFGGSICTLETDWGSSVCVEQILQKNVRNVYGTSQDIKTTIAIAVSLGVPLLVMLAIILVLAYRKFVQTTPSVDASVVNQSSVDTSHSCINFFKSLPNPCNLILRNKEGEGKYLLANYPTQL